MCRQFCADWVGRFLIISRYENITPHIHKFDCCGQYYSTYALQYGESTQPPMQWVPGALSPGREADHSPVANTEVKKMWIYTSTPPYAFMA
jgi:hypothetical protein